MSIIVLNATTKSIEALLEGAVATNQPEFSAHYADVTSTAFTESENDGVLNNTTAVSLVAAPSASTRRIVKEIVIYNADTAAVTVTIRINNSGSYRRIQKVTLAAGASWKLSDGGVSTSAGSGDVVGPASATDGHLAVFDGVTGKLVKDGGAVPTGGGGGGASIPPGRLSLEPGVPASTTDQVNKTMLYYPLMTGNLIQLWNGASWAQYTIASEPSIDISAFTALKLYDLFMYPNSSTPTLEGLVWTNATTRATALAFQNGWLVKSGDPTRLYLGTIFMDSASKCQDTLLKSFIDDYYHPKIHPMLWQSSSGNWVYNSTTYRQPNGDANAKLEFVVGMPKFVRSRYECTVTATNGGGRLGIGLDSTNTNNATKWGTGLAATTSWNGPLSFAQYDKYVPIGYHYLAPLESSAVNGNNCTFEGVGTLANYGFSLELER